MGVSVPLAKFTCQQKSGKKIQNEFMHHKVYSSSFQCNYIYQVFNVDPIIDFKC